MRKIILLAVAAFVWKQVKARIASPASAERSPVSTL
jgi:hypothetical protein